MGKKKDRIDFFKYLVCPNEIRANSNDFEAWCDEMVSNEDYLEKRSYLLLNYYSAFRKVYDYFSDSVLLYDLCKLYCSFSESDNEMIVVAKYSNYRVEEFLIRELERFFTPSEYDNYSMIRISIPFEKHNEIKIHFVK